MEAMQQSILNVRKDHWQQKMSQRQVYECYKSFEKGEKTLKMTRGLMILVCPLLKFENTEEVELRNRRITIR